MYIGMFNDVKEPEKISRAYLYSAIAKHEGEKFFYFVDEDVDIEKKIIKGKYYEEGMWKEDEFPYPDVIINIFNPHTELEKKVSKELQKYVPFTSYPVGSKIHMYDLISNSNLYMENVIPYKRLEKSTDVFDFLKLHKKIIVKPSLGHHGDNVVSIEEQNLKYLLKDGEGQYLYDKDELISYIEKMKHQFTLVIQKFIKCYTKNNEPYDLRIHMQKGKHGLWRIAIIYPRIGAQHAVATNVSKGATMTNIDLFLMSEFKDLAFVVKKKLIYFSLNFIKHFESLYKHKFDELGLDIGLDEKQKIWLYEVNWRPGHNYVEAITAKNAIDYAIHLGKNKGTTE